MTLDALDRRRRRLSARRGAPRSSRTAGRRSAGARAARARRARAGVELVVAEEARGTASSAGDAATPTSPSCSAATGRCCARCTRFLGTRRPGDRRQLRARRLPQRRCTPDELEAGARARVRRRATTSSSCRRSRSRLDGERARRGQRRRRRERDARPHGRARVGGRRRGPRRASRATAIICSTPSGSTAYNLSNGGPVLMWGLDAMASTFVAPHSLHARPLVVPRGRDVVVRNRTPDVPAAVLVDGHRVGESPPGGARRGPARRRDADAARDAARGDVLPPLPRDASRPDASPGRSGADVPPRTRPYDLDVLRRLRIENLVLIREAELELAPGLIAITGETGAGKTILAQAIGLLLGAQGRRGARRARRRPRRTSRRSSTSRTGSSTRRARARSRELRPDDEAGLVVARRVFADGRTRAYAWGRSVAREDVVAATERLLAMSASSRSGGSRGRRTSSTCSTRSSATEQQRRRREARGCVA